MKTAVLSNNYKILLFNIDLVGGAGKYIITLADALQKLGVDVHIIVYKNAVDYELPKGTRLHMLLDGKMWTRHNLVEKALRQKLDELTSFNLILSNSTPSNKLLSRLNLNNAYHVVHSAETKEYSGPLKHFKKWWRDFKYRKLYSNKNLITVSRDLEHFILHKIKARPKSIQTIYNPFDFEKIRHLANEKIPEIPKDPYIIHVGRFDMTSKRQDILLKAYKKADIPHKLVLLGEGKDEAKIKTLIKNLGMIEKVILPGFSNNPYAWIKHAKLFVFSSDFEGFGRTLAEALIVGTPAVSTDCPTGPREILTGTLRKFLVPKGDVDSLSKKIHQALTKYPDIRQIDISWLRDDKIARQYIRLIESSEYHANH